MPAILVPFGAFEPDSADLNAPVVSVATNVYPSKNGYLPMPGPTTVADAPSGTPSKGVFVIQTGASSYSIYYCASATITRIDSSNLASTTAVVPATATPPSSNTFWRAAKFGNYLIFAHGGQTPLVGDWSAAAGAMGVAALAGSPPASSGVFTIGGHVFLTGLTSNKRKLMWSALESHIGWTLGTGLCDEQEFPDGGDVLGIAGDKSGFVVQQNCMRSFQNLPGDITTIFQFSKIDGVPGCAGNYAWASVGQTVYYYSEEGFCAIGPTGFRTIGAHRVDRYFAAKSPNLLTMRAVADPYNPRIYFVWQDSSGNDYDGALVYDWQLDRWSETDYSASIWAEHIDATGGGAQIVLTPASALAKLSGANRSATITASNIELWQSGPNAGQRALITAMRPVVNGTVSSVSTVASETLTGSTTTTSSTTQETNGRYSLLAGGAYHKLSVVTLASNTATYHRGVQVWAQPDGEA